MGNSLSQQYPKQVIPEHIREKFNNGRVLDDISPGYNDKYDSTKLTFEKTIKLTSNRIGWGNRVYLQLPDDITNSEQHVVSNIRCPVNLQKAIMDCEVLSRHTRIEKIIGNTFNVLRHIYKNDDKEQIPFSLLSGGNYIPTFFIKFEIEFNEKMDGINLDEFELEVDIFKVDKPFNFKVMKPISQFTGDEIVIQPTTDSKLYYNFPISHIFIKVDRKSLENIKLSFNSDLILDIECKDLEQVDGYHIIKFTDSFDPDEIKQSCVDFSYIDCPSFTLSTVGDDHGNLFIHSLGNIPIEYNLGAVPIYAS